MEQIKIALEKLAALVASQRFQVTVVSVVVLAVVLVNVFLPLIGQDPIDIDEESVSAGVVAVLVGLAGLFGSVAAVVGILLQLYGLTSSIAKDPPTLREGWHVRNR